MSTTATASTTLQPVLGLPDPGEQVPPAAVPTVALWFGTLALFLTEMGGVFAWDWSAWVTIPMGAAVTFLMFSVLHESTHHATSTNTRVNDAFGYLSIPFVVLWATYPLVRFIHIEHHRNTNEPKSIDPDAWCESGPAWQFPLRWATVDLWYVVFYLRRIRQRPQTEVAAVLAVFTATMTVFGGIIAAGYGTELLVAYLIPQRIGILVLGWWFDYLPHSGLHTTQREDKFQATRIRVGAEGVFTPLFVYQNYHLVHHLHPSIPFYRYVRAWRRNEQAYLDRNAAISTWFGRSLTPSEYRTWRRITEDLGGTEGGSGSHRPVFHPLRISAVEPLTADSVALTFDVPADLREAYRFVQGQHLTLRGVVEGQEVRRSYSIVEPVSSNTLRVAVKRIDGGVFSTYLTQSVVPDEILDVMTPTGQFHIPLDPARSARFVAVAAGSGITPMMSTIATTLETEPDSSFELILGNRTTESTMFVADLDTWQETYGERLRVHHVFSRDVLATLTGRVDADLVEELVADPATVEAWFLCGPEQMVAEVKDRLVTLTDSARVLTEVFHAEAVASGVANPVTGQVTSQVTVLLDGTETRFALDSTAEPILDAALQQGLDAPYSCAGGACGTCRAKVLLGAAVMDQNHVLGEEEVADGYVLTCQAHPITPELLIDYDDLGEIYDHEI